MNDYKELLDALRENELQVCDFCNYPCAERNEDCVVIQSADAIERLCTDVERLTAENRAKEQYIAETIGKVIRERDAAIAGFETFAKTALDNPFACNFCKHEAGEHCKWKSQNRFDRHGCFGRHFEWRGVGAEREDK